MKEKFKKMAQSLLNGEASEHPLMAPLRVVAKKQIETAIQYGICRLTGNPYPGNEFSEVSFGHFRNELIINAEVSEDRGILIHFSNDCSTAYLDSEIGKVEVKVDDAELVKQIFDFLEEEDKKIIKGLASLDPEPEAIKQFTSELRYGTSEYLKDEFMGIYNTLKQKALDEMPEPFQNVAEKTFQTPEFDNIIEYLKMHEADISNVHIVK